MIFDKLLRSEIIIKRDSSRDLLFLYFKNATFFSIIDTDFRKESIASNYKFRAVIFFAFLFFYVYVEI